MSETLIGEVTKNSKEKILISLNEYQGHKYIDLRVHYEEEGTGEYKPTKKGIALSVKVIPEIISKLQEGYTKLKDTTKAS
tara:strand:- start:224 stop:463 length:240 start_codon:yes stop_codon:yes gene_type:complete